MLHDQFVSGIPGWKSWRGARGEPEIVRRQKLSPLGFKPFQEGKHDKIMKSIIASAVLIGTLASSHAQGLGVQMGAGGHTNVLNLGLSSGTLLIEYDFYVLPDTLDVYYAGQGIFSSGLVEGAGQFVVPFGPGASDSLTIVMNQGQAAEASIWFYSATVVPEPHVGWLLAIGACGVWLVSSRRRQRVS